MQTDKRTALVTALTRCDALPQHAGDVAAVYFTASWCRPCATFTNTLLHNVLPARPDVRLVFASLDRTEEAYDAYLRKLPQDTATLGFGDDAVANLQAALGIQTIPTLVIVVRDGATVLFDLNGREKVQACMQHGEDFGHLTSGCA